MLNSRAKGKRSELALRDELNALTTANWHRTQQRCGFMVGDVAADGIPLHIEAKSRNGDLAKFHTAVSRGPLVGDGIVCVELTAFKEHESTPAKPCKLPALVRDAMDQALNDRNQENAILVCVRMDRKPWIACWQEGEESRLREILGKIWR